MDKVISWWEGLDTREQMVAAIGGLVFCLGIFIFAVVLPLMNWRVQEEKRVEQVMAEVKEVRQLAARVKSKAEKSRQQAPIKNLTVLIDNSLRENEITMRGFQPGKNNEARLRLENAAYSSLAQLLYDLEYQHKVTVVDMSLTPASTSGRLMVSMRISQ